MSQTFNVRGVRVRSSSQRRFVAFRVERKFDGVRYVADAIESVSIFKRSDSASTLHRLIERQGFHSSRFFVVIDQTTGEEVA